DVPSGARRPQHELGLEGVAVVARAELEALGQRIATQAALGVVELPAAEQRQEEVRDAVRKAIGARRAVLDEIADAEHERPPRFGGHREADGFVDRMLAVRVDRDDGSGPETASVLEARAEGRSLAAVSRMAHHDGARSLGLFRG